MSGIQLFSNALDISEEKLFEQMEAGELLAKEVLPKVAREMKDVANTAGALDAKYLTTRVQQGRFFKELESSQKMVFDSGFDKGLASLFQTVTLEMRDSETGLKGLGKAYKVFFETLGFGVKLITPVLNSLLFVIGKVSDGFTMISETIDGKWLALLGLAVLPFTKLGKTLGVMGKGTDNTTKKLGKLGIMLGGIRLALKTTLGRLIPVIALFDELSSPFEKGRVGLLEKFLGLDFDFDIADLFTKDIDWTPFWDKFGESVNSRIKPLISKISDEFGNIDFSKMFDSLWEGLKTFLGNMPSFLMLGKSLKEPLNKVSDNISSNPSLLRNPYGGFNPLPTVSPSQKGSTKVVTVSPQVTNHITPSPDMNEKQLAEKVSKMTVDKINAYVGEAIVGGY